MNPFPKRQWVSHVFYTERISTGGIIQTSQSIIGIKNNQYFLVEKKEIEKKETNYPGKLCLIVFVTDYNNILKFIYIWHNDIS